METKPTSPPTTGFGYNGYNHESNDEIEANFKAFCFIDGDDTPDDILIFRNPDGTNSIGYQSSENSKIYQFEAVSNNKFELYTNASFGFYEDSKKSPKECNGCREKIVFERNKKSGEWEAKVSWSLSETSDSNIENSYVPIWSGNPDYLQFAIDLQNKHLEQYPDLVPTDFTLSQLKQRVDKNNHPKINSDLYEGNPFLTTISRNENQTNYQMVYKIKPKTTQE